MTSDTRQAPGLHVEPTASGRWVVCYEHHKQPLSDHLTASEAQGSAQRRALGLIPRLPTVDESQDIIPPLAPFGLLGQSRTRPRCCCSPLPAPRDRASSKRWDGPQSGVY